MYSRILLYTQKELTSNKDNVENFTSIVLREIVLQNVNIIKYKLFQFLKTVKLTYDVSHKNTQHGVLATEDLEGILW